MSIFAYKQLNKMRRNFLILIGLSILFLNSCYNNEKEIINSKVETISVNPKEEGAIIASEIIEDISFVPLETNRISILGDIDKIIYHNYHFYILDRFKQKAIFVFDKNGKFLNKIGVLGNGPGEFNDPADFIINNSSIIEVLDRFHKKKIYFDLNGKYLNEKKINIYASKLHQVKTDEYVYYHYKPEHNNSQFHLTLINENEGYLKEYLPKNDAFLYASDFQNFSSSEKNLYFFKSFDNYIYKISNGKFEPAFFLDFQSQFIKQSDFKNAKDTYEKINVLNSIPVITGINNLIFLHNHLFFVYFFNKKKHFNLIGK